jgi:hypothetical protein
MSYSTDPGARASFIGDLRALADFLDQHPAIPVPLYGGYLSLHAVFRDVNRERAAAGWRRWG